MEPPDPIRTKLDAGLLPEHVPLKTLAAFGDGTTCSACGRAILASEVQWSFASGDIKYRFHIGCHIEWQVECAARRADRSPDARRA
jgi:hypothetical protein